MSFLAFYVKRKFTNYVKLNIQLHRNYNKKRKQILNIINFPENYKKKKKKSRKSDMLV